jgi:hypothetical protein
MTQITTKTQQLAKAPKLLPDKTSLSTTQAGCKTQTAAKAKNSTPAKTAAAHLASHSVQVKSSKAGTKAYKA